MPVLRLCALAKNIYNKRSLFLLLLFLSLFPSAQTNLNCQWAKGIGGIVFDNGNSIVTDASGNVFIAGYYGNTVDFDAGASTTNSTAIGNNDIFITKYDAAGNFLWVRGIGSTGDDQANSIAIDVTGNIFITGRFSFLVDFDPGPSTANLTASGGYGMFIAKYDNNGNYIWAKAVGNNNDMEGNHIEIDNLGNCVVTGYKRASFDFDPGTAVNTVNQIGISDSFLAKYDANGNYVWAFGIGAMGGYSMGNSIATDPAGDICITGYFMLTTDFDRGPGTATLSSVGGTDVFFARYDANGNFIWAKGFGSGNDDYGFDIALDGNSHVCVTGRLYGRADMDPGPGTANISPLGMYDAFVGKYDNNGNYLWAFDVGSVSFDYSCAVKTDNLNDVYLIGNFQGTIDLDPSTGSALHTTNGQQDIYIAKYSSSNGSYLWSHHFGSSGQDYAADINFDGAGNLYMTGGHSGIADLDPNATTANVNWVAAEDIYFVKYAVSPSILNEEFVNEKEINVYPNPGNGLFNFNGDRQNYTIEVYDVNGARVRTHPLKGNSVDLSDLAKGIYFFRLRNETVSGLKTGKFIIE